MKATDFDVPKRATSFRLSTRARELLSAIAKKLGITQSGCLELMIRDRAEREKVK
jgi:predicted DNA-binding protein